MKPFYIVIIVAVILLGLGVYILFIHSKSANPGQVIEPISEQSGAMIPLDPAVVPSGEKITLGTAHGAVEVNNFYKVALGYDGAALVIRTTPNYEILYDGGISAFGIYIVGGSTETSLNAAENDLLGILGISQAEACNLNVSWSVSVAVDKKLTGTLSPLSFCPPR